MVSSNNQLKALVVEDNDLTQRLMAILLEKLNTDTILVDNELDEINKY